MPDTHNHERIKVLFFVNKSGYVIVAPDRSHPTPQGYERREATTLREVDMLTAILNRQDTNMFKHLVAQDIAQVQIKHGQIRSKLGQRLLAIDCGRVERLFIEAMFRYLDKKEVELSKCEVRGFFHQREYDSPGSDPIENHGRQLEATAPKMSSRLASLMSK